MSDQPRRKNPRRIAPAQEENPTPPQVIEKIGDITDEEFFPRLSFFEASSPKSSFRIKMQDSGDHRYSRTRGRKSADPKSFGLQNVPGSESSKGKVKNFRPLAEISPANSPEQAQTYEKLWTPLKEAVNGIFDDKMAQLNEWFGELYDKVHLACNNNFEQRMFTDLKELFQLYLSRWMEDVEQNAVILEDAKFLEYMDNGWQSLCRKIKLIRNIFLVLDRRFCGLRADTPGILEIGIGMCRELILRSVSAETKLFQAILSAVEQERKGDMVNRDRIKNIIRMLADISLYESKFETIFIEATKDFYSRESLETQDVPAYMKYVNDCLESEEDRIVNYLQVSTRKRLIPTVEYELIQVHQTAIISRGAYSLIDDKRIDDLKLMYSLLSRTPTGLVELCRAFRDYIKNRGGKIVNNDGDGSESKMVPDMLDLKEKIDEILKDCFSNDGIFKDAAREGFEHFINQRANKPAEMIAKYVDLKLKAGNMEFKEDELERLMDRLLILFRYIHGKDVFEAFYKKDLAKRLLLGLSASVDSENLMLQKLKTECGSAFTSRLEGMFRDIELSKETMGVFADQQDNPKKSGGMQMDFQVHVLTQGIWPLYTPQDLNLPESMNKYLLAFQHFYSSSHSGRKLQWIHHLGQCRLKANYEKNNKELQVSLTQAVILLLFNEADTLSFKFIQTATKLQPEELKNQLASLSGKVKILLKDGVANVVSSDDQFTYNENFQAKAFKIKINAIQAQASPEEEQKTQEGVIMDRQHQIDAAIVRLMKERKSLKHSLLLAEIYKELKFPVTPGDLKKRIESLIERDYMCRDVEDQTTYNYVA